MNRSHAAELDRVPAPALVIVAVLSVQLGAAVAKSLFDDLTPNGVVALRLVFGGIVLGLLFRPRIRNRPRAELRLAVAFGLVLVAMNLCFFQALDRIPLLAPGIGEGLDAAGVAFALAAGVLWGAYILLGVRVGKAFAGPTGLVLAMGVGACVALPLGVASAGSSLLDPALLAAGFGVAVLSSAITTAPGQRSCTTAFSSWRNCTASRFSRPPYLFGIHSPAFRL